MITRKNFLHNDVSNLSLTLSDMIDRVSNLEDFNDYDENLMLLLLSTYSFVSRYMEKFNESVLR